MHDPVMAVSSNYFTLSVRPAPCRAKSLGICLARVCRNLDRCTMSGAKESRAVLAGPSWQGRLCRPSCQGRALLGRAERRGVDLSERLARASAQLWYWRSSRWWPAEASVVWGPVEAAAAQGMAHGEIPGPGEAAHAH